MSQLFVGGLKRLTNNDEFDVSTIQEHYPKRLNIRS